MTTEVERKREPNRQLEGVMLLSFSPVRILAEQGFIVEIPAEKKEVSPTLFVFTKIRFGNSKHKKEVIGTTIWEGWRKSS